MGADVEDDRARRRRGNPSFRASGEIAVARRTNPAGKPVWRWGKRSRHAANITRFEGHTESGTKGACRLRRIAACSSPRRSCFRPAWAGEAFRLRKESLRIALDDVAARSTTDPSIVDSKG